ncbi:hypothetical protein CAI21_14840 [Alkalilimnicola ehrlichii]|uniref:Uncharacterized protein n=1 Tax=Alkalilimnicola ehrlichii TaxID=351052 RepID=A0A3E0WN68_9GAMM|nr:hypothetical protein [Alkalilimnicola ehrlichii]RFA27312.1 hypothetical protein CAI21_14840 [Alkalilimnicola ehrlichii]RFA34420.1 hypothetical protein CAL65_15410 [Alkalilimnicola ehrlichii]
MTVSAKFEEKHAFVLCPKYAGRLWDILEQACGPTTAEASCADGIQRTFTSRDQLTSYENPRARSVNSLTFSARDEEFERRASITLGARYSSSIVVSIDGPEDVVVSAKNTLGEVFDGIKPWYSPISRIDFFYLVLAVVFFAFTVLNLTVSGGSGESQPVEVGRAILVTAAVIAVFAGLAALVWILNMLRTRFFPIAVFALGQGQGRYELDEKVRWVVIVGIAVSVVASLVVSVLLR